MNHQSIWLILAGIALLLLCIAPLLFYVRRHRLQLQKANRRIGDLEQANRALELRRQADEDSPMPIIIIRANMPDCTIESVNPAFEHVTGHAASEVIGRSIWSLYPSVGGRKADKGLQALINDKRGGNAVVRSERRNGSPAWYSISASPLRDETGAVTHFVLAQHDVSEMKRYQAELELHANYDSLTGLANRALLRQRLEEAIAQARDHPGQKVWVAFIDLDRFKIVNDSLGRKAGDRLINTVAERLIHAVRESDTVARLGGDEFAVLMREADDSTVSAAMVDRLVQAIAHPASIDGHEFTLTCSIGIAVYPDNGEDAEKLIEYADIAMYSAKEHGRNNYQFYHAAMNERALARLQMEMALRGAVERGEFGLHYQPQVDLKTGNIVGMEALVHWKHPQLGIVPPGEFITLAEETGLIVQIGAWVMHEACRQNKAWQDAGLAQLRVAVNLSARQFAQPDLVDSVNQILQETGLSPHFLEVELTESLVMTGVERSLDVLRNLKAHGIQISIDDFGTGYSSLSYLKRFPIDVLKIDKSFVQDITSDPDDETIVSSIISLAHSLKLHVIAEGVESHEQLAFLEQNGCDEIQGYYFSRPVPPATFAQMLRQQKTLYPARPATLH
ncbi:putative bifunctional diguanylate cyclase/phosphodiesterase [Noviherbaspirillum massiliense]|uniref:putative bifunctional diguanylate cyclase/phosphodiesterase n=1 Tax=Noviherbaspirillum massiliense TaxID=1465823 RepID=UPI0002FC3598|nr:EAL domain-containing protein [Noviherbaspirillum massiliense]